MDELLARVRAAARRATPADEAPVVGHRQLLQEVWGPQYGVETNYLRVHIANLRRKLEPDPSRPRYLLTEPGMGHRFVAGS
jgi:two-component system KDP operon response regulator KdpE